MSLIWRLLIGGLWKPLAWLFGAAGLWLAGRRSASQAGKIKDLEGYQKTRKAMDDEADAIQGDDPSAARVRLYKRGQSKRDL